MKKIFIFLTFATLLSCGGVEFETFTDQSNGFQIDYPKGWDTTRLDLRMAFMAREDFKDSTDIFSEGMSVSVFNNEGRKLKDIVDENVQMAEMYYSDSEIEETELTTHNGIECIQLKLQFEAGELKLTNMATFFNHGELLYTITQSTEQHKSEEYKGLFEEIINSFNWLEKE